MDRDKNLVERDKNLEMAMSQIERQFGKGAIMKLSDGGVRNITAIPTGALSLDLALGIGGVPRGRIVEIFGPESSGKTTLALHVVAEAQRNGGIAAFVDAEHALDPLYAKALGVDVDELLISQPDTGEQALEITDMLIRSGALDVVVIDSVAALVPRAELEGDMGDVHMGLQARLMSQALRKLAGTINRSETTAVFINQLREKIGVMFGSPETTPRWQSPSSSTRVFALTCAVLRRSSREPKMSATVYGPKLSRTRLPHRSGSRSSTSCSARVSPERAASSTWPWIRASFISREPGIRSMVISWARGREKAKLFLRENAEVSVQLQDRVMRVVGLIEDDEAEAKDDAADVNKDTADVNKDTAGTDR